MKKVVPRWQDKGTLMSNGPNGFSKNVRGGRWKHLRRKRRGKKKRIKGRTAALKKRLMTQGETEQKI